VENKKGNAHRQENILRIYPKHISGRQQRGQPVFLFYVQMKKVVEAVGQKKSILKVGQNEQVEYHTQANPELFYTLLPGGIYGPGDKKIIRNYQKEDQYGPAPGFVIKIETEKQQNRIFNLSDSCSKRKYKKENEHEYPELQVRKNQRFSRYVGKGFFQPGKKRGAEIYNIYLFINILHSDIFP
jgi:hypothetical protein